MKALILILVIVSVSVMAQSPQRIARETVTKNTYLAVGDGENLIFCGYTQIEFFFNNKRLILDTPAGSVDLRIVERTSDKWLGVDKHKNYYTIIGFQLQPTHGSPGLIIAPNDRTKMILGFKVIDNSNLCQ